MNRQASGRVSIFDEKGKLLDYQLYYTKEGRQKIVADFKMDYRDEASYIQIRPYTETKEARVKKRIIKLVIEPPKPMIRPPAIYDNQRPSLYA
jgi:hypothetical protein